MVTVNVVARFRHQNDLHTYRRKLAQEISQDLALRLLPPLADLPLDVVDARGAPCGLGQALRLAQHITLAGPALQQWALSWAADEQPVPALLALPRIDDGASSPERLLAPFAQPAGHLSEHRNGRDPLALFRHSSAPDPTAPPAHGLLLIHGWDDLPPERRAAWRETLCQIAQSGLEIRLVVTLPIDEPVWPCFTPLAVVPPSPARVAEWVEILAPAACRVPLLEALAPSAPLHPLSERLFDVALLAWRATAANLPRSRAELYAQALAGALGLKPGQLSQSLAVAQLQLLAAYGERPAAPPAGLVELSAGGVPYFDYPQTRRYLAARQLVAERRYDLLTRLDPAERSEMALLVATMLDDPTPLYAALWGSGRPRAADALALGRCLRERTPRNPSWTLRVVGALARLACQGAPGQRDEASRLLPGCMPVLDTCLAAAAAGDPFRQFLVRLLELLPPDLAAPGALRLVAGAETPEPLAWMLADMLVERGQLDQITMPPPSDRGALARWIYLRALCSAAHEQLDPALAAGALAALAESGAGAGRQLRATTALLENPRHASTTRLAALALLAESDAPTALTVIERAAGDASPDVRRAALAALGRRDPERALTALGRAATDGAAPWELRLDAIQQIGDHLPGAIRALERCAGDQTLPLYARLAALAALGRQSGGLSHVPGILNDADMHVVLRRAAARALGAARYRAALPDLLRLLDEPLAAPELIEGCCDGLGSLASREAGPALLRLIERSESDVTLTLAAVRALGQLDDPEIGETLGQLLGAEALHRLHRALDERLLQQTVEACLDDSSLPPPIARRLARTLAATVTPDSRPSTPAEFLGGEADRVRAAAARALATIGSNAARAALMSTLLDDGAGGATTDLIAALAEIEGPESAEALGYLIETAETNPLTRWLIVRQLTDHPAGETVMRRALVRADLDPFTRGALAEGLGQRGALAALPALRQLAADHGCDMHLRSQALLALGLLNDTATEPTLIHVIGDLQEDAVLRGMAAEYLPAQLSDEGRRFLRELLRHERQPAPIVIGALRTQGRARDHEALPLMLRYCQDESSAVAQAAIEAMADLGDGSVAPLLVRITQQPTADHALRLEAAGALLRIGGDGYRPLLRIYLNAGALPFRLLALEHLIEAGAPREELLAMLVEQGWPATLRLRLIERLAGDPAAAPALMTIADAEDEDDQLRALAVEALGHLRWAEAAPALSRLAEDADVRMALRLRAIDALQAIDCASAWATISRLAEDAQPAPIRHSAIQALCRIQEV